MQILSHICLETFRNAYIIVSDKSHEALMVDPAGIDIRLIEQIEKKRYSLKSILLTSPRALHNRPVKTLKKIYPVDIYCVKPEMHHIDAYGIEPDEELRLQDFNILPISMPSYNMHTVVYQIGECIFTGDVLKAGKIGEPTSSFALALLKAEIQEKILSLPYSTMIFPAQGPPSTIEAEIRTNPYLQESYDPVFQSI